MKNMKNYGCKSDPSKLFTTKDDFIPKLVKENRNISENEIYQEDIELNFTAVLIAVGLIILVIVVGFIGNLITILAVKRNKQLQTISNIFIVNLSVCDVIDLCAVLPFNIYTYVVHGWYLGHGLCKFIGILGYSTTGTTILTITMIAYNRYKLVLDPSTYRHLYTKRNITIMLVLAWIIPLLCLSPAIFGSWGDFGYVPELVTCNLTFDENSRLFRIFLLATRALMPCIVIIYLYSMIFRTTHRSHQQCVKKNMFSSKDARKHKNFKKEMRLTKMMMAIFIVFIISYFPCTITSIIDWENTLSQNFHMYCVITVYIGSAINPIIYGLMNKQFRKEYKNLLTCSVFPKHDVQDGTSCSRVYKQNFRKTETIQVKLSFPLLTQEEVEKRQNIQF